MKSRHFFYIIGLFFAVFLYFSEIFIHNRIFSERDLPVFFYPSINLWVKSIKAGEFPLWNPFIMCGEPLLAAIQPGVLYPLSVLFLVFPVDFAFNLNIVLHFFLSGVFTFMLMKETGASDEASAISTITYTFGGYLLSVHNLLSTLVSVTWFPLVLLVFMRALRLGLWKYTILCALCLYCMFSGGGMEIFLMTSGMLIVISFFPFLYGNEEIQTPLIKRFFYFVITFLLFLLFGAVEIIPFLELFSHSIRSSGISYQEAVLWSFVPKNLIYMLVPDIFWKGRQYYWIDQSWLKTIYTGILPFFLLCFFVLERGKRRALIGIVALGALLLSFGRYCGLYGILFEWLPGLRFLRYPVKFFFIVIFLLCLCAGWGWDSYQKNYQGGRIRIITFLFFFAFGFLLSALFFSLTMYTDVLWTLLHLDTLFSSSKLSGEAIVHNIRRVMVFAILGSTWLYLIPRTVKVKAFGFYGIIFLLFLDLFWGNYGFFTTVDMDLFHQDTENQKIIRQDNELCRFFVQKKILNQKFSYKNQEEYLSIIKDTLIPNTLIEKGGFDINGFSILSLKHYYKILTLVQSAPMPDSTNLINIMNVKYVLWSERINRPGYKLLSHKRNYLYENTHYLKRVFLVKNYKILHDEESFRKNLQSLDFDPSETVLLKVKPKGFLAPSKHIDFLKDSAQIVEYKNCTVKIDVTSSCRKFLVFSDTFYPGWKAYIDGKQVPVYEANFAFRSVVIPEGYHRVEFRYEPLSFKIGACISIISFAAVLLFLLIQCRRRFLRG